MTYERKGDDESGDGEGERSLVGSLRVRICDVRCSKGR